MIRLALLLLIVFTGCARAGNLPDPVSDTDFRIYPDEQVKLGRLLFYDRILSNSMLVSCGTCHNHDRATSNGPRIDGALVEGDAMAVDNLARYLADNPSARHAPPLFNLGATEFTTLFGDGRIAVGNSGGFIVPDGVTLPDGLRDILAVQALLPAVTPGELATHGARVRPSSPVGRAGREDSGNRCLRNAVHRGFSRNRLAFGRECFPHRQQYFGVRGQ